MNYEELLVESDSNQLITKEKPLKAYKGRIKGNRIAIKKDMTTKEKGCVLAEELGHHFTTVGDILDQSCSNNQKQELLARTWAYDRLIGLKGLIDCYNAGCKSRCEMAEYLDVTEEFLNDAIERYRSKYGSYTKVDSYVLFFEPNLAVLELR